MSNQDDEWPYDDHGFPKRAFIDIDWLLKGAGFEGEARAFESEDDLREEYDIDFLDVDDNGRAIIPTRTHGCECNPTAMYAAAQELARHFRESSRAFPRDLGMIEDLRGIHPSNGAWRRWVDPQRSLELDNDGTGKICMWGCGTPGHHCMVERLANGNIVVTGASIGVLMTDAGAERKSKVQPAEDVRLRDVQPVSNDDAGHGPTPEEDAIDREEERYDERTFGDLDEAPEPEEEAELSSEFESDWREAAFPSHDLSLYRDMELDLEQVQYLARFMPPTEVGNWVERFGVDSMVALELLRIGMGEISYNEEILELDDDRVAERIAEGIRMALHGYLRKFRQSLDKQRKNDRSI